MAIASSYPKGTPKLTDTLIGIQYEENKEPAVKQFSIDEVLDLVPVVNTQLPYKVFTALLTQTGASEENAITGTDLTVGVSYTIYQIAPTASGFDFTNVGAPNNNLGTSFIATGTIPNNWGTNVGLEYNTGAPTVTVLENTIGNIWFEFSSDGRYVIFSNSLFTIDKTFIVIGNAVGSNSGELVNFQNGGDSTITLWSLDNTGAQSNNVLLNTPIEIRVYN